MKNGTNNTTTITITLKDPKGDRTTVAKVRDDYHVPNEWGDTELDKVMAQAFGDDRFAYPVQIDDGPLGPTLTPGQAFAFLAEGRGRMGSEESSADIWAEIAGIWGEGPVPAADIRHDLGDALADELGVPTDAPDPDTMTKSGFKSEAEENDHLDNVVAIMEGTDPETIQRADGWIPQDDATDAQVMDAIGWAFLKIDESGKVVGWSSAEDWDQLHDERERATDELVIRASQGDTVAKGILDARNLKEGDRVAYRVLQAEHTGTILPWAGTMLKIKADEGGIHYMNRDDVRKVELYQAWETEFDGSDPEADAALAKRDLAGKGKDTAQDGKTPSRTNLTSSWASQKVRVRVQADTGQQMADTAIPGHPLDVAKQILDTIGPDFLQDAAANLGGIHVSIFIED